MTMQDMKILERNHSDAVKKMGDAATAIAEYVIDGHRPTQDMVEDYRAAKLGVESTRRDLEYCLQLELQELLG